MFTTVLFAAFLSLIWENFQTGRARLWLLPVLMVAWVNLHLGLRCRIDAGRRLRDRRTAGDLICGRAPEESGRTAAARLAMAAGNLPGYVPESLGMEPLRSAGSPKPGHGGARAMDQGMGQPAAELECHSRQVFPPEHGRRIFSLAGGSGSSHGIGPFSTPAGRGVAAGRRFLFGHALRPVSGSVRMPGGLSRRLGFLLCLGSAL